MLGGFIFPYKMCKSKNPNHSILHRELQVPILVPKQIRRPIQATNTKDFVVFVVNKSVDNHKILPAVTKSRRSVMTSQSQL